MNVVAVAQITASGAIEPHPAANLFPMMDDARLAELAADIHENGLREPIQLLDGLIIDGRNRYRACQMAGITPQFRQVPVETNPWAFVWSLNGQRRDLTTDQRYILWAECAENDKAWQAEQARIREEANRKRAEAVKERERREDGTLTPKSAPVVPQLVAPLGHTKSSDKPAKPTRTTDKKAEAAHVDRGTVERNDWLKRHRPDLHEKVKAGETTSSRAYTAAKKAEKVAAVTSIAAQEVKAAQGVYDVIVIDPPWPMEKIEREVRPNQAAFDYPTMTEAELSALELPAADDCHVWVWTTHKFMPMAFRLLDAWRLKYVCTFVWHKPGGFQPIGLPQYNCEFALYARRGAPVFLDTKAFPVAFEVARFLEHHGPGTKARLALLLFLCTGASRQDAARMGWQNIEGGRIRYRRGKTGIEADLPILPELVDELRHHPTNTMLFLTHGQGRPYKPETLGSWFKDQCKLAGLYHCTAHGLRKAGAVRLANHGATEHEIAAFLAHKDTRMASLYARKHDRALLADSGFAKLEKTKTERNLSNLNTKLDKRDA